MTERVKRLIALHEKCSASYLQPLNNRRKIDVKKENAYAPCKTEYEKK